MLDLQEYGVRGRLELVLEMFPLEDDMEEVVVVDVLELVCVYTFVCVEIKTKTETEAVRMFLTFCLTYHQSYEVMTGPKSSELLT